MTDYPRMFRTSELIKMTVEELTDLEHALSADWKRVTDALEIVSAQEMNE